MSTRVITGDSPDLREQLAEVCREFHLDLMTMEITYNAHGDILKIELKMMREMDELL
jgi:hypothetical protein